MSPAPNPVLGVGDRGSNHQSATESLLNNCGDGPLQGPSRTDLEPRLHRHNQLGFFLLAHNERQSAPSKSEKCEIAETQLRLRARLEPGRIAGYRPRPDPNQMAFRICKEAMSDIWRWPVLKRKMAIRSRQKTSTSTPNIISDRCSPNRHNKRRLIQDAIG